MPDDLYQTLDNSLAQLQQTGQGLDQLQGELSAGQQELMSLLRLAQSLESLEPAGPGPAFTRNARIRIWNTIQLKAKNSRGAISGKRSLHLSWRRALAGGFLALALVFSGLGVASASALPGDALYNIKRGIESVQMALVFTDEQEAGLLVQFAQERVEEIEALSQLDRPQDLNRALGDYSQTMDDFLNLTANIGDEWDDNLDDVQDMFSHHTQVLQAVQERAPQNAQDALQQAIERSAHGQAVIEILQQGGNPSELAPGQQNRPEHDSDNQSDNHPNHGNANGRNKDKINGRNNHGNNGRGNPHNEGNPPVDPQDIVEDAQED